MRTDNWNYDLSTIEAREDRYIRDKFANRGEQLILDAAAELAGIHKQLPPHDAPHFAEAVKLLARRLKDNQEGRNTSRAALPARLPNPQRPSKPLKFQQGRKRALTGLEAAEREEADRARARQKADKEARAKEIAQEVMDQMQEEREGYYDAITEAYDRQTQEPLFVDDNDSFRPFPEDETDSSALPDMNELLDSQQANNQLYAEALYSPDWEAEDARLTQQLREIRYPVLDISSPPQASPALSTNEATLSQIRPPWELDPLPDFPQLSSEPDETDESDASSEIQTAIPTSTAPPSTAPTSSFGRVRKPTKSKHRRTVGRKRSARRRQLGIRRSRR